MNLFCSARRSSFLQVSRMALAVSVILAMLQLTAHGREHPVKYPTYYRTIQVDGLSIFYREAGPDLGPLTTSRTSSAKDSSTASTT